MMQKQSNENFPYWFKMLHSFILFYFDISKRIRQLISSTGNLAKMDMSVEIQHHQLKTEYLNFFFSLMHICM